jgi:hypothetical protein
MFVLIGISMQLLELTHINLQAGVARIYELNAVTFFNYRLSNNCQLDRKVPWASVINNAI